jgi:CelD/BcsL family acetyltransferase involved in cellulose biosynthesis
MPAFIAPPSGARVTKPSALALDGVRRAAATLASIPVPRRSPMLHEIWLRACAEAFNPDGRFEVLTVGPADSPTAGAAFARHASGPLTRLALLGAEDLWEPGDVFFRDAAAAASLATRLVARGLPVRFGHFAADSPFLGALKRDAGRRALVVTDPVPGSPYIALDESWREPETKFSPRSRRDLGRKRRKAEALGAVTFEVVAPAVEDVDALLDQAIAVEAASWKSRSKTALAFDETLRAFFAVYARLASEAGILRIAFLRIGGTPVAVQVAVVCDDAYWQLKMGYDEAYRDCSPGALLMLEVVRHSADLGLGTFEFLGKSAPWTRQYTETEHPNVRLRIYPMNPAGGAVLATDALGVVARRARALVRSRLGRSRAA